MARHIYGKNPHYQFRDQDPVIDEMRELWRLSGFRLSRLAVTTGLSHATLHNWFVKKSVRRPFHDSVKIFFGSFGVPYGRQGNRPTRASLRVIEGGRRRRVA